MKLGKRDPSRGYSDCYHPGRGAHNRTKSIFKIREWDNPSTCKSEAARINRKLKRLDLERARNLGFSQRGNAEPRNLDPSNLD